MKSRKMVLTMKRIALLSEAARYLDMNCPGLYFEISGTGGRSFGFRYTFAREDRCKGYGPAKYFRSVDEVRDLAWADRKLLLSGTDPNPRTPAPIALSIEQCWRAYVAAHTPGWRSRKHRDQWTSDGERFVFPVIGALPADKVGTPEILGVEEQPYKGTTLWLAIPSTASRLRGKIEQVLDWAKARGHRTGENPARWKGHLDQLLPAPSKIAKQQHQPALDYRRAPEFMPELRNREGISARALEFLFHVACRTNELTQARRSEVDWNAKVWTIPASRMKGNREHRVPLSPYAIKLLESLPTEEGSDFLFVGARPGKPISNAAMAELMKEIAVPSTTPGRLAVPHGFRSTFRDWTARSTNFPRELAEAALAHALENEVEASYQRGDLLVKRRRLMEAWSEYCNSPPRASEVVPIRKQA